MPLTFDSITFPNAAQNDFSLLRATFNQDIKDAGTWLLSKFRAIPLSGGIEPKIENVEIEGTNSLDITISIMTGEIGLNSYKFWIESGYLSNAAETETLDAPDNEILFVGQAVAFIISSLKPVSLTSIRVTFNRRVLISSDLLDPTKYTFDNDLQCLGVMLSSDKSIDLVTTAQTPDTDYQLSIEI